MTRLLDYLPRGNTLDDQAWQRRHRFLQWVLGAHLPALFVFGVVMDNGLLTTTYVMSVPAVCLVLGHLIKRRRPASILITAGLTYCSAALVGFSGGSIEAHFHFFIMIGFIALYQDWVPFLWNTLFTVVSHGLGSVWTTSLIFSHPAGQTSPWVWSGIHGAAVLLACVGMVIFWWVTEEEQHKREALAKELADAEIGRRRFTSDLLVNLARRNQSMLYRQLDIINALEEKERDPDALAELFHLDHLATRVRRNAESLLVLSGEKPSRVWSAPVPLRDIVRAAIAETEDLDRVDFVIDEWAAVSGQTVTDLTHLLAELTENAVRFSAPQTRVTIRTRPYLPTPDAFLLTVEDLGVGMPPDELAAANQLLADPPEVDLSVSQRLGFHVVARLAQRHDIRVSLTPTPGCGLTAVVVLPAALFAGAAVVEPVEQVMAPAPGGFSAHQAHQYRATAPISTMSAMPESIPVARGAVPSQAAAPVLEGSGTWTEDDDAWAGWWYATAQEQGGFVHGNGGGGDRHVGNGGHAGNSWPTGPAVPTGPTGPAVTQYDMPAAPPMPRQSMHRPAHVQPAHLQPVPPTQIAPAQAPPVHGRQAQLPLAVRSEDPSGARPSPGPRLSRRVPQSHLAPELRVAPEDVEQAAPAHTERASAALSRYQASRQAAKGAAGDAATGGWQEGHRT